MATNQLQRTVIGILGITIILGVPFTCLAQSVGSPFHLGFTRNGINSITFTECQETDSRESIPGTMYFLNETRLDNVTTLIPNENNGVTFQMSRELEGYFSCGNGSSMSNTIPLIARPDMTLIPTPPTTYAIAGERVKLNCSVPPGRLIQQYYVTWDRSGRTIYRTRLNKPPETLDNRYSVNPSDLSLIINNVRLEDTSDKYHCVFTVVDPQPDVHFSDAYTTMQSSDIQLIVLGNFSNINVYITNRCMVEFFIDLGVTYTQGVKLSLSYTNATNTSQTQEVLTSTVFSNGTNISHAECGGLVPFTKFTVEVRLMFSGSIYGPYNAAPGEHNTIANRATIIRAEGPTTIVGAILGGFNALLIVTVLVLIVTVCRLKKSVRNDIREGVDTIESTIHEGNFNVESTIEKGKTEVIQAMKEGNAELMEQIQAWIQSAGPPQNNGTKPNEMCRIAADSSSAVELVDIKKQRESEALISFISTSLSAALENPQIRDEVKRSVDSVVKKHWQDII